MPLQPPTDQQRAAVTAGLEELIKYVQLIMLVTKANTRQLHHHPPSMESSSKPQPHPLLPLGLRHALQVHAERVRSHQS
jgi:hypothetical protein